MDSYRTVEQWGRVTVTSTRKTVTFPIAFGTFYAITGAMTDTDNSSAGFAWNMHEFVMQSRSNSGFSIWGDVDSASIDWDWIAVGKA